MVQRLKTQGGTRAPLMDEVLEATRRFFTTGTIVLCPAPLSELLDALRPGWLSTMLASLASACSSTLLVCFVAFDSIRVERIGARARKAGRSTRRKEAGFGVSDTQARSDRVEQPFHRRDIS